MPNEYTYITRFRLSDGSTKDSWLKASRRREPGEMVNLPVGSDGESRSGKGFIWRIAAVEQPGDPKVEAVLVLDFEAAHPDQT